MTRFQVVLDEDVRPDIRKLAPLVAAAIGKTALEAKMFLRRTRGLVGDPLPEEAARAVVEALGGQGIAAKALAEDAAPRPAAPSRVVYLSREGDLLVAQSGEGDVGAAGWEALRCAVAGIVGLDLHAQRLAAVRFDALPDLRKVAGEDAEVLKENLLLKIQSGPAPAATARESRDPILDLVEKKYAGKLQIYLDFVFEDLSWWRMRMDQFTYRFREDSVKIGGAMGMRYVLNDLLPQITLDRCSPGVTGLLDPGAMEPYLFGDVEEFTRYALWWWLRTPPLEAAA